LYISFIFSLNATQCNLQFVNSLFLCSKQPKGGILWHPLTSQNSLISTPLYQTPPPPFLGLIKDFFTFSGLFWKTFWPNLRKMLYINSASLIKVIKLCTNSENVLRWKFFRDFFQDFSSIFHFDRFPRLFWFPRLSRTSDHPVYMIFKNRKFLLLISFVFFTTHSCCPLGNNFASTSLF